MSKEEEKKLLELFNPKNKKILDVGCGDGRYATLFAQLCQEYVGIDISSDLIKRNLWNNKYQNVSFYEANIVSYKPSMKFDIIILSLSFHEIDIKEQGLALMNMLNLLNDDGKIIILDPSLSTDSFQALWNIAYENFKYFNHDYIVQHTHDVITKACDDNLCRIVCKDKLDIPFYFSKLKDVCDMIAEDDDFSLINWSEKDKEILSRLLKDFIKKENDITLFDKLDITVLEKR